MIWDDIYKALSIALVTIIGAVSAYVVRFLNRRTDALDREQTRSAAFDAGMLVEERSRKGSVPPAEKLELAVRLANEATPARIQVTPRDVEAQLPRVRASMVDPALLSSMRPPPMPAGTQAESLPYPPLVPRDTSREKAPLR